MARAPQRFDPARRRALQWGCLHCAALGGMAPALATTWVAPARLPRPELSTDEGGLWALVDREEARVRRSAHLMREHGLREYLAGVACKLGGDHCSDTRVYPVRTPFFNASMAPNGMMQVWSGLLLRMDNEAQLAAVMGHEIGHYLQRHSLARLQDARSRSAFMSLMVPLGGIGLIGQLAALAGMSQYSRSHESEADAISLVLMHKAGYATAEAAKVWAHLRAELTAGAGGDPAKKSVLFASHPPTDERQQALGAAAAADTGGSTQEAEYQARIEPWMPMLLEDELHRAQYDETIALTTRLAAQRPQRADLRYARGEAQRLRAGEGDADKALADFAAAAALDKPPAQVHRGAGLIHKARGQKNEAAQAFDRYLQAAPGAVDAGLIKSYLEEMKS